MIPEGKTDGRLQGPVPGQRSPWIELVTVSLLSRNQLR